jgi:hypothetical protein
MKRVKGDLRILGDGGFVEKVVSDSRESFDTRYALRREGWDFDRILDRAVAFNRCTVFFLANRA